MVDLILENADESTRYVVEIMLGKIDPSHIVRLIEYWDIEKRRNPSWSYEAVLIAEDTTRYLNVLHVIQYSIPITVLQMVTAQQHEGNINIGFTKVFEGLSQELEVCVEEVKPEDWIKKSSAEYIDTVEKIFDLLNEVNSNRKQLKLNYVTPYIGAFK